MNPLPTKFTYDGFDFKVIHREGPIAVLSKTKPYWLSGRLFYEVVILHVRKAHTWPDGHTTPEHEAMPADEEWGTRGWSFDSRSAAFAKCDELQQCRALACT